MSKHARRGELEARQQTIKFFETLLRASTDGIVITDATQNIVMVNEAFCTFFGRRWQEVIETNLYVWLEQLNAAAPRRWAELEQHVRLEGTCRDVEFRMWCPATAGSIEGTTKDGERHLSVNASLLERVTDKEGGGIISIWRDITERVRMEEALQETRDELKMRVEERTAELAKANEELRIEITERVRAEKALQQRNREFAMLNRASQVFTSTLDLDQVLTTVLEEVCHLLGAIASAVWLIDPTTNELVCRQVINPHGQTVRGWRLAPGEGVAGWVAQHGQSLVVPDTRLDPRHFKRIDQTIGLEMRSILSVPLQVKQQVIGVIQVVDTAVNRFSTTDLTLLESLAATAAIAIENARLYEAEKELHRQALQDAQTKLILLNEVNHRVKNNLAAIIGLLYAEQGHTGVKEEAIYQSIMKDLINRIQGLATVHRLLSAAEWTPLSLDELAREIIYSALQILPPDKDISVEVLPSPVRVTPDQANNLALVINELATNTVKYALSGRSTACITVRITLEEDIVSAGHTILFEFRDDGPGYPEEVLQFDQRGHNVGFDLIQNIVWDGLGGELVFHNDDGAVTTIRFKAEVALVE